VPLCLRDSKKLIEELIGKAIAVQSLMIRIVTVERSVASKVQ